MRATLMMAALLALAGCNEKKDNATPTTVAPTPTPATAAAPTPAAKPADLAAPPADMTVAAPDMRAAHVKATHPTKPPSAPPPIGIMPHGKPEDGTLKYNPPAPPPPSGTTTKK